MFVYYEYIQRCSTADLSTLVSQMRREMVDQYCPNSERIYIGTDVFLTTASSKSVDNEELRMLRHLLLGRLTRIRKH